MLLGDITRLKTVESGAKLKSGPTTKLEIHTKNLSMRLESELRSGFMNAWEFGPRRIIDAISPRIRAWLWTLSSSRSAPDWLTNFGSTGSRQRQPLLIG
jgi:hypothetical protein